MRRPAPELINRNLIPVLEELLHEEPVLVVNGARSYTYEDRIHMLPLDSVWHRW